jgi:multimeric flavodoxin WrbA
VDRKLVLHDLSKEDETKFLPQCSDTVTLFSAWPAVHHCVGCFGCWIKTPGRCVIGDRGSDFAGLLATHNALITVSRPVFGWLSSEVKALLDRSISFLLPFFTERNGGMHHIPRYDINNSLKFIFYGDNITEEEQLTAKKIAKANSINLKSETLDIIFCNSLEKVKEALT